MRKRSTILILATILLSLFISAQKKVGTTSMQFLKVMPTARATAMGDASVAFIDGIDAVFWNPAGLTSIQNQEIATTYTLWIFDTKQDAIAYGINLGDYGTIGAQFQMTDIGNIEETKASLTQFDGSGNFNPGLTGNTFTPLSLLVGVSYAQKLTDHFSTGVSIKYATEALWEGNSIVAPLENKAGAKQETYNATAKVFLFDFGMRYNTGYKSLQIGASVQNFGSQVKFAVEDYPTPLQFRLGISGNLLGNDALFMPDEKNTLTVSYEILQPNDYDQQMHFGAEYGFMNLFKLRAGYKYNYDNEGLTFGGGVKADVPGVLLGVDYSFGSMGTYLGNVHRISLGVQFK